MRIEETTSQQFDALFAAYNPIFNTAEFAALNAQRCDEFHCLLFIDSKVRLGLIAAKSGNDWMSPFSAPFGGFVSAQHQPTVKQAEQAVDALIDWLKSNNAESFRMTMPPLFYHPSLIAKMQFACLGKGFCISDHALNFHVLCEDFTNGILQKRRSRNAERNLKSARSLSWNFYKAEGEKGLKEAYKIIAQNRSEKGYSLSMDEKTVLKTADCIQTDAFILTEQDKPVASAIVLHLTPDIVQVVYWGDVAQPASVNPMVLFTHYLFDYYSNTDLKIIDTGTAMLDRQANYGLCDFKESIGCEMNPKLTLLWEKL